MWVRDGVMCEMVGCAVAWWVVVEGVTSGNGGGNVWWLVHGGSRGESLLSGGGSVWCVDDKRGVGSVLLRGIRC